MKLSTNETVQKFDIQVPIWKDGGKVGLATHKVVEHNVVNILATDKDGNRLYPNSYYISGKEARTYVVEPVKSHPNIKLYIIPIADLEYLEWVENE